MEKSFIELHYQKLYELGILDNDNMREIQQSITQRLKLDMVVRLSKKSMKEYRKDEMKEFNLAASEVEEIDPNVLCQIFDDQDYQDNLLYLKDRILSGKERTPFTLKLKIRKYLEDLEIHYELETMYMTKYIDPFKGQHKE